VILPWYAAHFRTDTLRDRLPIAVIGQKIRPSNCKLVKLFGCRAELVTSVLFVFFRPRPNEQSLPSAIGLSHLTVPPSKHQVS
jgi:hypothetical protein